MPFYEREEKLLELLSAERLTTVDEICEKLYISKPTVRRDLDKLAKKGLIKRTHGGVYLTKNHNAKEEPFRIREQASNDACSVIAKKAAEHIQDGFVIMLDGSECAFSMIPYLADFKDLLIITNSAKISFILGQMGIENISSGGRMNVETLTFYGEPAINCINKYNGDICFLSPKGISPEGYLTDSSDEENAIRYAMIKNSRKKVVLCQSSKFDQTYINNLCHISEADEIISEYKIPHKFATLKNM